MRSIINQILAQGRGVPCVPGIMVFCLLAFSLFFSATSSWAEPMSTVFTYQGRLLDDGTPANGMYDFEFKVYDDPSTGIQVGITQTYWGIDVFDGLFTLFLDFGPDVFTGEVRYLEIGVRPGYSPDPFTLLSPRQPLMATPYALYALEAPWNGLTGVPPGFADEVDDDTLYSAGSGLTLSGTQFNVNFAGSGSADTAARSDHDHGNTYWRLSGNTGTNPATNFLGTTDAQALELRVDNSRALRLEPHTASPNLIGGYHGNAVASTAVGATIGGGGGSGYPNRVTDNYGTIGGGQNNQAGDNAGTTSDASFATISGGINNTASAWYATIAGGNSNQASSMYATIGGGDTNNASDLWATVGGGIGNTASGEDATVAGGYSNQATGDEATVAGGVGNQATGNSSTVAGGVGNQATGNASTIGGGHDNIASAAFATIAGGGRSDAGDPASRNRVTDNYGTVSGGGNNQAGDAAGTTDDATYATVSGGEANVASANYATVGGGTNNNATSIGVTIAGGTANYVTSAASTVGGGLSNYAIGEAFATVGGGMENGAYGLASTVGGGRKNWATGNYSTIGGGRDNSAEAEFATIAGGGCSDVDDPATRNRVTDDYGTVGGGGNNQAGDDAGTTDDATYATVSGGYTNVASAIFATVGGGAGNYITGAVSTVGGGLSNYATGEGVATVGGGTQNVADGLASTVGGGLRNWAIGDYSTIGGGYDNYAPGDYSFACGSDATATHNGSFVWSSAEETYSWDSNTFTARAHGGVRFYSASGTATGVQLSSGGTSWGSISDRNAKENFAEVDSIRLLHTLAEIPINSWNLKAQSSEKRHIGPVAQDFNTDFGYLFGEVESPVHINNMDAIGVSMAAIQGLFNLVQEKDAQISAQQREIKRLEERLAALEQVVSMKANAATPRSSMD